MFELFLQPNSYKNLMAPGTWWSVELACSEVSCLWTIRFPILCYARIIRPAGQLTNTSLSLTYLSIALTIEAKRDVPQNPSNFSSGVILI